MHFLIINISENKKPFFLKQNKIEQIQSQIAISFSFLAFTFGRRIIHHHNAECLGVISRQRNLRQTIEKLINL